MGPLGAILALFLPSPVDVAKRATSPNPYAPSLPAQANFAVGQNVRAGVRPPWSPTGSEADYPDEQTTGRADVGVILGQFLPGRQLPPSMFDPNLPPDSSSRVGQGTGPQTGPYKGWVVPHRRPWGSSNGRQPIANASTLLSPLDRSPLPREMADGFVAANKGATRLEDVFSSPEDA